MKLPNNDITSSSNFFSEFCMSIIIVFVFLILLSILRFLHMLIQQYILLMNFLLSSAILSLSICLLKKDLKISSFL